MKIEITILDKILIDLPEFNRVIKLDKENIEHDKLLNFLCGTDSMYKTDLIRFPLGRTFSVYVNVELARMLAYVFG